jgi:hypothetical protein
MTPKDSEREQIMAALLTRAQAYLPSATRDPIRRKESDLPRLVIADPAEARAEPTYKKHQLGLTVTAFLADVTRDGVRTKAMAMVGGSIALMFALSLVLGPLLADLIGLSGIFVLTAVLALTGIAVNSAIVLIDAANDRLAHGMSVVHATLYAARRRVVPIIITTTTTIGGLSSLAFGLGGQSLLWGPVAASIVWGLAFSTVLTLFMVPLLYLTFMRFKARAYTRAS